jgi:hypothetical protein
MNESNVKPTKPMPRYRCHKEVRAFKIKQVVSSACRGSCGGYLLVPEDESLEPQRVGEVFFRKHNPQAGGYYVKYADGYDSYSPAKAFEEGYTQLPCAIIRNAPDAEDIGTQLKNWLDTLTITGENIGDIRRRCFLPWECGWNSFVREETARRETKTTNESC